jgi:hypothetical protein
MRPGVALSPQQHDHSPIPPGKAFKALLSVSNAVVIDSQHGGIKCTFDFRQIYSMFVDVSVALRLVPRDHVLIV